MSGSVRFAIGFAIGLGVCEVGAHLGWSGRRTLAVLLLMVSLAVVVTEVVL